jgi:hypothetical protein
MVRADFHAAIEDAKAGDGANDAIELELGDLISFFLLLENAGAAKSTALMWGRNSRITDEQRSISSGLVTRAILQGSGLVSGMGLLSSVPGRDQANDSAGKGGGL